MVLFVVVALGGSFVLQVVGGCVGQVIPACMFVTCLQKFWLIAKSSSHTFASFICVSCFHAGQPNKNEEVDVANAPRRVTANGSRERVGCARWMRVSS